MVSTLHSGYYISENGNSKKEEFLHLLEQGKTGYTCILTDDTIFYRNHQNLTPTIIKECLDKEFTFSFRLGFNTIVQNYATGELQPPLRVRQVFSRHEAVITWSWRNGHPFHNYYYPIGMDACMYKTKDLLDLTNRIEFDSLRSWEGQLCTLVHQDKSLNSFISAPIQSLAVNVPTNNVQVPPLPCGTKYYRSVEELNKLFLQGYVIDFENMDFNHVVGCHQEIELKLKGPK
jgi:hypothetical protein